MKIIRLLKYQDVFYHFKNLTCLVIQVSLHEDLSVSCLNSLTNLEVLHLSTGNERLIKLEELNLPKLI